MSNYRAFDSATLGDGCSWARSIALTCIAILTHSRLNASPSSSARPTSWPACPSSVAPRVPARALLNYLAAGDSLLGWLVAMFLDDFPSVRREQAIVLSELTRTALMQGAPSGRLATSPHGHTESSAARPPA
jgi:hypothetical protein